jgi:hypothetical protein
MLVAGLGGGKRWQGKGRHARVHDGRYGKLGAGLRIAVAPVEHEAAFANVISSPALQPP